VPSRRFGTAHSSGRTHDFHNAPSTKPSITATASVAIGCCFRDLSIAPLTFVATSPTCSVTSPARSATRLACWVALVVRSSARSATFRTWSVALSLRSDLRSVLPPGLRAHLTNSSRTGLLHNASTSGSFMSCRPRVLRSHPPLAIAPAGATSKLLRCGLAIACGQRPLSLLVGG
jgi:hypothetical protein